MIVKISIAIFISLHTYSLAHGIELSPPPVTDHFGLTEWSNRRILEIPEGEIFQLYEDTELTVDELVINGVLVTNGFNLRIDVHVINFGEYGKIIAFNESAQAGPKGLPAATGSYGGGQGGDGNKGGLGQDGEQDPGAIVIHASRTVGLPQISSKGQDGGSGGRGSQGGTGGIGSKGRDGWANCLGMRSHGGQGRRGGQGGLGGQGGDGGRGGREVPLIYATLEKQNDQSIDFSSISGGQGAPGKPGSPGDPGKPGEGGPGGEPYRAHCFLYTVGARRGAKGRTGPPQQGHLGKGNVGGPAPKLDTTHPYLELFDKNNSPVILPIDEFDNLRQDIGQQWFYFHWARTFAILFYETLREVQRDNTSKIDSEDSSQIFDQLISNVHKERLSLLKNFWVNDFIKEIETIIGSDPTGMRENSLSAAREIVKFLELIEKSQSASQIVEDSILSLERIKSRVNHQVNSSLESAMLGCRLYLSKMRQGLDRFSRISSHFNIPVCMGDPDFSLGENLGNKIRIYSSPSYKVPSLWVGYVREIGMSQSKSKSRYVAKNWFENLLINTATARNFSIKEESDIFHQNENFVNRLPVRNWQLKAQGTLLGYPEVSENMGVRDISSQLLALSRVISLTEDL